MAVKLWHIRHFIDIQYEPREELHRLQEMDSKEASRPSRCLYSDRAFSKWSGSALHALFLFFIFYTFTFICFLFLLFSAFASYSSCLLFLCHFILLYFTQLQAIEISSSVSSLFSSLLFSFLLFLSLLFSSLLLSSLLSLFNVVFLLFSVSSSCHQLFMPYPLFSLLILILVLIPRLKILCLLTFVTVNPYPWIAPSVFYMYILLFSSSPFCFSYKCHWSSILNTNKGLLVPLSGDTMKLPSCRLVTLVIVQTTFWLALDFSEKWDVTITQGSSILRLGWFFSLEFGKRFDWWVAFYELSTLIYS